MMSHTSTMDWKDANAVSDNDGTFSQVNESVSGPTSEAGYNTGEAVLSVESINADDPAAHVSNIETPIMPYDAKENFAGLDNPSHVSIAQLSADDSSVKGNGLSQVGDGAVVNIMENGGASADGLESAALHQPAHGSGLSAEEERLWSIVTANSLDFSAWTALIEETERASEGNILKIRKVYDAFLAEFPLCYGYWKKYADHESRLSSVDKVAEVYERAVQGVTYSVDMWVHYCVFAIGAYGDPDTIRSHLQQQLLKCKV